MADTTYCDGLYELTHAYDGFIIDQWGVLHQGLEVPSGTIQALNKLKAEKKQVIILSNSGKRSEFNKERLKEMGIKPFHYQDIVTAGEVVWQGLNTRDSGVFKGLGDICYLISRNNDRELLQGLDLVVSDEVHDVDFILVTGVDSPEKSLEDYEPVLRKAVARGLPLICANPDLVTVFGKERQMGPGALAQRYKEFGGVAHMIGKPHKPIFQKCIDSFKGVIPSRILVIGDSLYHDIAGAKTLNLDTAFVTSGIHSQNFKDGMPVDQKHRNLEHLIQNYGVRPEWAMDHLIWQSPEAAKHEKERESWTD